MLDLERLVAAMGAVDVVGRAAVEIEELAYSSDAAVPGTLFFCVPGGRADGHDFAAEAVQRGDGTAAAWRSHASAQRRELPSSR